MTQLACCKETRKDAKNDTKNAKITGDMTTQEDATMTPKC